jgi:hypothetical protein
MYFFYKFYYSDNKMRQVTDIRHLVRGDDFAHGMGSAHGMDHAHISEDYSKFHTSIDSLMKEEEDDTFHFRQAAPRLACSDVMRHIRTCPVCSKLYTVQGDIKCDNQGCSIIPFESPPQLNMAIVILYILLIIVLVKLFSQ